MRYQYKLPVAGVTFEGRQAVLAQYTQQGWVPGHLEAEPTNRYDSAAVQVYLAGQHIGYIPKESSARWSEYLQQYGHGDLIVRCRIVGGTGGKNLGCLLFLQTLTPVGENIARAQALQQPLLAENRRESDLVVQLYAETRLSPVHPGVWSAVIRTRSGKHEKHFSGKVNDLVAARVIEFTLPRILDSVRQPHNYVVDIFYGGADITAEGHAYPLSPVSEGFLVKRYQSVFEGITLQHVEAAALTTQVKEARQLLSATTQLV
jgi:hypothetical protein